MNIIIGTIGVITGTFLQITEWDSGEGALQGGYYSIVAFIINGFGVYFLLDLKFNNYKLSGASAILYPLFIVIILHAYSCLYLIPRIENQGGRIKAVVTKVYYKPMGEANFRRSINYKYIVDSTTYIKTEFSEKFETGDSIIVRYHKSNPNFHLIK